MLELDALSMDELRVSSHKVVDTLAHAQSSTAMSKSCSGISLASSQTTQRTKCCSGFSTVSNSIRGGGNSSAPQTPGPCGSGSLTEADSNIFAEGQHQLQLLPTPSTACGGGNTVLGGVAPTMQGMLRRRARFSGWRAEVGYFEVRSSALVAFSNGGKGGNWGGGSPVVSLASIAQRIMHPSNHSKASGQVGEWGWSVDLAGAERVSELPALSKKGTYAFAVEFGAAKKKTLVLAAGSAVERERWIRALDVARDRVKPEDFTPLSVIGEGHFGKVMLVRWHKRNPTTVRTVNGDASSIGGGRDQKKTSLSLSGVPARVAEEGDDENDNDADTAGVKRADSQSQPQTQRSTSDAIAQDAADGTDGDGRLLAVKEVALHKGTSLPGVLNERQILGVLREHPFVVTLQCAWRRGNFLYYGLDFLPGADLFELFRRQYIKMDIASARVYGGQVALALEHLHAHGICYRDLKPENILVDAKGHLKLADMGLSKILGVGEDAMRTSTVCGTRAYLAPEMILRKPYGFSVDYWQFGCFLFELYAGHSPFWTPRSGPPGSVNDQTVALILAGEISYPRSMEPVAKNFVRQLLHPAAGSRLGCRCLPKPEDTAPVVSTLNAVNTPPDNADGNAAVESVIAGASNLTVKDSDSGVVRDGLAGWDEVRGHEFFAGMDWEALLRKEVPAPLKPGAFGKGMVGNFSREYTRQRVQWGGDQQELRDVADKEGLFKRELLGFDFVRHQ